MVYIYVNLRTKGNAGFVDYKGRDRGKGEMERVQVRGNSGE